MDRTDCRKASVGPTRAELSWSNRKFGKVQRSRAHKLFHGVESPNSSVSFVIFERRCRVETRT
jgi:hypothetical protein